MGRVNKKVLALMKRKGMVQGYRNDAWGKSLFYEHAYSVHI